MMFVFVLSIIYKMALYMIYANFLVFLMTFSTYELLGHRAEAQYLDLTRDALFYGGHPLLESGFYNIMPLFIIAIVAACAYLLYQVRPRLRFIPMALLPLCFYPLLMFPLDAYLIYNIGSVLLILAPCIYLIAKISRRKFSVDALRLKRSIKRYAILAFAPLLVLFFHGLASLSSIFYFQYVIIFIAGAIGILRSARATEKMLSEPKFLLISLAPVMITMLFILGSQQIAGMLWRVIQFVSINIITPVINFIARGIEWFFALFYIHDPSTAPPIDFVYDPGSAITFHPPPLPENPIHSYVLAGVFTIILAIVVYKVLKAVLRRKQKHTKKSLTEERNHVVSLSKKKYSEKQKGYSFFAPKDPRMAVRYHYRRFLKICAEKGVSPEQGDTSEEINIKNKKSFPVKKMSRLRELYIKARYSKQSINKNESKEANELVKELEQHLHRAFADR